MSTKDNSVGDDIQSNRVDNDLERAVENDPSIVFSTVGRGSEREKVTFATPISQVGGEETHRFLRQH